VYERNIRELTLRARIKYTLQHWGQFKSLERSLVRNEEKCQRYTKAIEKYMQEGHVELVHSARPDLDEAFVLPHHAVFREDHATTKARIVFNGSAVDNTDFSLNDALLPGPALQPDLVLIKFRRQPYALTGDIAKMFLQILIQPDQRNYLRFFWKRPGTPGAAGLYRFRVLPFNLNCAPFLAIHTVAHHLNTQFPSFPLAARLVGKSIYVDDILGGAATENEVTTLRTQITELMEKGGFHLTKWLSNSGDIMKSIPEADRAPAAPMVIAEKNISLTPDVIPMALGIMWNPKNNLFEFQGAVELMMPAPIETM
jgi:hypothetical protein